MPSLTVDDNSSYVNFYGKNAPNMGKMTKDKIEKYGLPLLHIYLYMEQA